MSLYAIVGFDAPGSKEKRLKFMEPHCKELLKLKREGRLHAAGPLFHSSLEEQDYAGSIMIIDFASQQDADNWFLHEPYNVAGVYKTVTIKPYYDGMEYIEEYS